MKRLSLALALLVISLACAADRRTVAETQTPGEVEQELRQLQRQLIAAIQRRDRDALNRIWADEYLGTAPNGRVVTKADLLSAIEGGAITVESIEFDDMRVRLFDNMALLTGHASVRARVSGEDMSGSYRGTGIYIKRNNRWEVVGVHVGPDGTRPASVRTE
jgi:ketosteroid isomerase-like protein